MTNKINIEDDYYEVLGVSPDSSTEEIKTAFRKKAMEHHPDRTPNKDDSEMKRVNEAWEVLSNPRVREQYDSLRLEDPKEKPWWQRTKREREQEEREEQKKKEKLIVFVKEIKSKLEPYFLKVPGLREKHILGRSSIKNITYCTLEELVNLYKEQGVIFKEDLGVFDYFLNNNPSQEELEKVLLFTRQDRFKYLTPIFSNQIDGLKAEFEFSNAHPKKNRVSSLAIKIAEAGEYPLVDFHNREVELTSGRTSIHNADFSRFAMYLSGALKSGDYKMKLSQKRKKEHDQVPWYGYWIDDLTIRGVPLVMDRKSQFVKNNFDNLEVEK